MFKDREAFMNHVSRLADTKKHQITDKERLDWLDENFLDVCDQVCDGSFIGPKETLRRAIDAAIKREGRANDKS